MELFKTENLGYSYDHEIVALDSITMSVQEGELVGILGANGSGKSTLLQILAGLIFPTSGLAAYKGESITPNLFEKREFRRKFRQAVGLVFQNSDLQLFTESGE